MARIVGTSGNDILRGTSHRDVIKGGGGKDKIVGRGGNDLIKGGNGKDTVKGNSGNDVIKGGGGGDNLIGGGGNDTIKGQGGRDNIKGNSGDDDLYGNKGADNILGAKGADDLWGGGGGDVFKFNAGDGFYDGFDSDPAALVPPSLPNTFDDVIHDFAGFNQGGNDKFDTPSTVDLVTGPFDEGFFITYGDGAHVFISPVGSFLCRISPSFRLSILFERRCGLSCHHSTQTTLTGNA